MRCKLHAITQALNTDTESLWHMIKTDAVFVPYSYTEEATKLLIDAGFTELSNAKDVPPTFSKLGKFKTPSVKTMARLSPLRVRVNICNNYDDAREEDR